MLKNPRRLFFPQYELSEMEREAISFIRDNEPASGYQVGFSGGKDSIVTLDLVKKAGVKYEAFCSLVAGNDNPSVLRFVRREYPDVKLVNNAGTNFFKLIETKGLPSIHSRWCCDVFKEHIGTNVIVGIRAEESARRAARPRLETIGKCKPKYLYKPIFKWQEWAVWEYIEKYGLAYPEEYDNGYKRLGCIVCPFALGRKTLQSMLEFPAVWKAVKRSFEIFYNQKQRPSTAEDFWRLYISNFDLRNYDRYFPDGAPI